MQRVGQASRQRPRRSVTDWIVHVAEKFEFEILASIIFILVFYTVSMMVGVWAW
jgi:hypothetical protein